MGTDVAYLFGFVLGCGIWLAIEVERKRMKKIVKKRPRAKAARFVVLFELSTPTGSLKMRSHPLPLSFAQSVAARFTLGTSLGISSGRLVPATPEIMDAYAEWPHTGVCMVILKRPIGPCWRPRYVAPSNN